MRLSDAVYLAGGLALFLYGMRMMGDGLEAVAGNRMKRILERLTTNRILGVVVGALITAVIQSSSATTAMLVGFVNSGIMSLNQAVWVIMGSNIGTTITGQLIALDISRIAPLIAFVGVIMVVFLKRKTINHSGTIIAGLGVLFIGMSMMSSALSPLRQSEYFINLMTTIQNPVLGILIGIVFTSIIQSSSASIGILQTLAMSGLIELQGAVYIMLGMKIGTCVTAALASVGTGRSAKRVVIIHYAFNIIEAILFAIVFRTTGILDLVYRLTPANPAAQIANMHTICSVVMTIILLPFGRYLVKFAGRILPEKTDEAGDMRLAYISNREIKEHKIGYTAIIVTQLLREIHRMFEFAKNNVLLGFLSIEERTTKYVAEINKNEEIIDYLNKEIAVYISHVITADMPHTDAEIISAMLTVASNIERIGDHAENFADSARNLNTYGVSLSDAALDEVREMRKACTGALDVISKKIYVPEDPNLPREEPREMLAEIEAAEQLIDDITIMHREQQMNRMKEGTCDAEASIIYSEMLTDFERIGDHMLNIAQAYARV
ncbi:MAG: Na/Pi cotransporter family protein [Oscillospiraceae bacterium]|nr:Na/Pi cotransporter family protein [Oscillospiraceae bacterium]